ncbi:ABC transporter permease [Pseudomonas sp. WN033]|nr:ABC transporter permease [Pseudomonas sp. WN033]
MTLRSPVLLVALQEWRYVCRQRLLLWLFGLLLVTVAIALLQSWQQARQLSEQQQAMQQIVDQQWQQQPDRHPHRVAHFGTFAFRQPSALGFFDPGVDPQVGNSLFLEAHRQNPANFSAAGQASSLSRLGQFSPAFVLQVVLPLFLMLLAAAAVLREREQLTGRLLLAQGLAGWQLRLGKVLAYAGLACLMVALVQLQVLLVQVVTVGVSTALLVSLFGLWLGYCLALLACIALAVWLADGCRDTRQALLLLTALWLALVVIMPRVMPFWLQPERLDSRVLFDAGVKAELRAMGDSHNPDDPAFGRFREQVLKRYGVARVEDLPVNYGGLLMQEGERLSSEVFERHYARLQAQRTAQEQRLHWTALINPLLALQQFSMALSGTDPAAFRDFEQQAEAYRYELIQRLNHLHTHQIAFENDRGQRVSQAHWQAMPMFVHQPEQLAQLWRRSALPLAALLLWCLLLGVLCYRGGRR